MPGSPRKLVDGYRPDRCPDCRCEGPARALATVAATDTAAAVVANPGVDLGAGALLDGGGGGGDDDDDEDGSDINHDDELPEVFSTPRMRRHSLEPTPPVAARPGIAIGCPGPHAAAAAVVALSAAVARANEARDGDGDGNQWWHRRRRRQLRYVASQVMTHLAPIYDHICRHLRKQRQIAAWHRRILA